ncbi:hypothetical protein L0F63_003216, partial [Massospora cicadina]
AGAQCLQCDDVSKGCNVCKDATCTITTRSCFECPRILCIPKASSPPPPAIWATAIAGGVLGLIVIVAIIVYRRTHHPVPSNNRRMSGISMVELVSRISFKGEASHNSSTLSNHSPVLPYPAPTRASKLSLNFRHLWNSDDTKTNAVGLAMSRNESQSSTDFGNFIHPVHMTNRLSNLEQKSPMSMLGERLNFNKPLEAPTSRQSTAQINSNSQLPSPVKINPALISPIKPVEFGFSLSPSAVPSPPRVSDPTSHPALSPMRFTSEATVRPGAPSESFSDITVRPEVFRERVSNTPSTSTDPTLSHVPSFNLKGSSPPLTKDPTPPQIPSLIMSPFFPGAPQPAEATQPHNTRFGEVDL